MTIVTSTYRYKPPPKRKGRKLAEITGPRIVTSVDPKKSRRPVLARKAAAESDAVLSRNDSVDREPATQSTTATSPLANDGGTRKSAIVTARKPRSRRSVEPHMTPEEHKRRGDAADAMFQEMKRRITGR